MQSNNYTKILNRQNLEEFYKLMKNQLSYPIIVNSSSPDFIWCFATSPALKFLLGGVPTITVIT